MRRLRGDVSSARGGTCEGICGGCVKGYVGRRRLACLSIDWSMPSVSFSVMPRKDRLAYAEFIHSAANGKYWSPKVDASQGDDLADLYASPAVVKALGLVPHITASTIVVSHAFCWDGMAAQRILMSHSEDAGALHVALSHNKASEAFLRITAAADELKKKSDTRGEYNAVDPPSLFMVDCSFDLERSNFLNTLFNGRMVVLDHHMTAKRMLGDEPYACIDTAHAACTLAHAYHYLSLGEDNVPVPAFLQYIEEHDLGMEELPSSALVNAAKEAVFPSPVAFTSTKTRFENAPNEFIVHASLNILPQQQAEVDKDFKRGYKITLPSGVRIAIVDAPTHLNPLARKMGTCGVDVGIFLFTRFVCKESLAKSTFKTTLSMRSTRARKDEYFVDVESAVAGVVTHLADTCTASGGGHQRAAALSWTAPADKSDLLGMHVALQAVYTENLFVLCKNE